LINITHRFLLPYFPQAHHEHSTEVQMPFIKHYLPDSLVVELVYAYAKPSLVEPKSTILDYRTSADASGDTSRVVGYMSALFH
jgi:predicted class III extradiol MEMO1 family dioxygenase